MFDLITQPGLYSVRDSGDRHEEAFRRERAHGEDHDAAQGCERHPLRMQVRVRRRQGERARTPHVLRQHG